MRPYCKSSRLDVLGLDFVRCIFCEFGRDWPRLQVWFISFNVHWKSPLGTWWIGAVVGWVVLEWSSCWWWWWCIVDLVLIFSCMMVSAVFLEGIVYARADDSRRLRRRLLLRRRHHHPQTSSSSFYNISLIFHSFFFGVCLCVCVCVRARLLFRSRCPYRFWLVCTCSSCWWWRSFLPRALSFHYSANIWFSPWS